MTESHRDRVHQKYKNNEYFNLYDSKEMHEEFDSLTTHEEFQSRQDHTFYFVVADCKGALEIFRDEVTKRDHLLGLNALW